MILVVDDDPNFLEQAQTALASASVRGVLSAENAIQALRLIQKMRASLSMILIDLNLPKVSGFELIATVREKFPEIPIIAISGVRQGAALESAKVFGASEVLSKPITGVWEATLNRIQRSTER